jgi:hypothetical protein
MTWELALQTAGTVILFAAAVPFNAMLVMYLRRMPWRKSKVGWALLTLTAGMAALCDLAILRLFIGDLWVFSLLRFLASVVVVVAAYMMWRAFWEILAAAKRERLLRLRLEADRFGDNGEAAVGGS